MRLYRQLEYEAISERAARVGILLFITVQADGSASTDGDATPIASYRFDFGDGSAPVTTMAPTATVQHTYAAAGTYTVTLVVTATPGGTVSNTAGVASCSSDPVAGNNSATASTTVNNLVPVLGGISPSSAPAAITSRKVT